MNPYDDGDEDDGGALFINSINQLDKYCTVAPRRLQNIIKTMKELVFNGFTTNKNIQIKK